MKITAFYRFIDLDARIGILYDPERDVTHVAFMAQGNAYTGVGDKRRLVARNPDRRAAVDRIKGEMNPTHVRAGKASESVRAVSGLYDMRKAYSAGRTYRFDVLVNGRLDPETVGLVQCENRACPVVPGFCA